MSSPRKPSLAARIVPPPIPPRTHSIPPQPRSSNVSTPATAHTTIPSTIQQPAPAAVSTHRRSYACQAPIIWNNRDEKTRREQTEESEKARERVLEQGIKVRDFQAEVDERKFGYAYKVR